MKKLTLILWLLLSTTIWSFAYDFQSGDLCYNITGDSTVEVTYQEWYSDYNYSGLTSAIIPESVTYNGTTYSVTSIGENAFYGCSGLTSVTIPNSVTSIGGSAFEYCSGLTSVTIPNSVTSIGGSAFEYCSGLTSVTIPNSVTSIGGSAFEYCSGLTSVTIPNSVTSIGESAFYGVFNIVYSGTAEGAPWRAKNMNGYADDYFVYSDSTKITLLRCSRSATGDIVIPSSVTSIGGYAFQYCSGLTSVTIPNSVTSIGDYAFYGVFNIVYSGTAEGAPWGAQNMNLYADDYFVYSDSTKTTLLRCSRSATGDIVIPNSVMSIGKSAFEDCSGLTSITIPNSVTSIGERAFSGCSGLTSITIGNSVTWIGDYAFYGCSSLTSVTIPDGVTSIGREVFSGCSGLTSITIGNSVTWIGDYAFSGCSGLTSITIPNGVTSIGSGIFSGCSSLISITVGNGNTVYDSRNNCNAIIETQNNTLIAGCQNSIIPNSVTRIGGRAFAYCRGLTSITIPNGVTSIGEEAFSGCSGLTSITIPNGVTSIGDYVFSGCSGLTSITIPDSVTSIGSSAFFDCSGLTSIAIPNGVTSIGGRAFAYCHGLTSVTIPNSVTNIGESAFSGCSGITSVIWNAKNAQTGYNYRSPFFDARESITSFTFGDEVDSIPASLCNGMKKLTSIVIPSSVTSIGESAFSGCSGITSVIWNAKNTQIDYNYQSPFFDARESITSFTFGDEVDTIPAYLCNGMKKLTSVTIPNSVTSIGYEAFSGCSGLTSVTIPNSVTEIGGSAFRYCSGFTSVTIPNSVTSIGDDAFYGVFNIAYSGSATGSPWGAQNMNLYTDDCFVYSDSTKTTLLRCSRSATGDISILNSVTSIGDGAFSGCSGLTSITIPNGVTTIGSSAFSYCRGLTSITIPSSVTSIGSEVFGWCSGLTSITIPNGVTSIGNRAFYGCSGLTSVVWNAKNCPDFSYEGTPFYYYCYGYGCSDNLSCTQITSFTFGDSVQHIPAYICKGMSNLTSITIGSSVTSIGEAVFSDCTNLTSVTWNAKNYADCTSNRTPFYERSSDFDLRHQITSFIFGDSVRHISAYICNGMDSLTSITIPSSVTSIGNGAFYGCYNLTKTNYIGDIAGWYKIDFGTDSNPIEYSHNFFINDILVTDLVIPEGTTSISNALSHDTCLTSVTIPSSVTSIGSSAFGGCEGLTSVVWNAKQCDGWSEYSDGPFFNNCHITSFTFGEDVESIPYAICDNMCNLTTIVIPDKVTSIGASAFYGCSSLTSITIGKSVTSIGNYAFKGCTGLESVVWNAERYLSASDGKNPFYNSANRGGYDLRFQITSFVFGNSVKSIPAYICNGMYNLTSITIPNGVTTIGESAFSYCSGLTSITIPNSVTSIGNDVFRGCWELTSVVWNAKNCSDFTDGRTPFYYYTPDKTGADGYFDSRSLTSFIFGDSVQHIPAYICNGMTNLTSITIPNSVTSIGECAFSDCSGPTSILVEGRNKVYDSRNNCNAIIETQSNTLIAGCQNTIIPGSVTSIGNFAFSGCSGLTSVTIPNSVTSIEAGAFSGCSGLTSITIPNSVTSIGWGAFSGCSGLTSVTIPNSITSIGDYAFSGCSGLTSVIWNAKNYSDFTDGKTPFYYGTSNKSSDGGFDLRSQITSFVFGDSVQHIPAYICSGMSNLTSITVSNSVTSIGEDAFMGTPWLDNMQDGVIYIGKVLYTYKGNMPQGTNIIVKKGIVSIMDGAFSECHGLTSVTIPQDVMNIGTYSFRGCTSLTHVKWNALDYTATNPFYCESVGDVIGFDLRKQITSFVCSDSVYAITPGICYQMTNLDTIACPIMALESENTNMENYPKALKYIKLLNGELTETIQSILSTGSKTIRTLDLGGISNTEIPDEAFREFYKMDTLVLPAQLTKIPYKAVSECVALQSIVVPEGVTEIEYGAFSGCSGLQILSLPSTLQSIADNGFASCSALKEMRVHAQTPPTVYANTFSGVKRTIPVYVPQSAYNDYTAAEVWKEFFIQSDVADDVENVPSHDTRNQGVHKVLCNGQIYIIRDNKTYTLTGEEVK